MNEELEKLFVPYNESLALKELGFDKICFGAFYADIDRNKTDKYDVRKKFTAELDVSPFNDELRGLFKNSDKDYYIASPTFSQAFKFFRDKYKMAIINPDWGNKFKYKIFNLHLLTQGVLIEETGFKTHEEAELACLRKLIEIVKNNG